MQTKTHTYSPRYDISEADLMAAFDILDRSCDDDITDDVTAAMESIFNAIRTMRNREVTPAQAKRIHGIENEAATARAEA